MTGLRLELDDAILDDLATLVAQRLEHREAWVGVAQVAAHLGCKPQRIYNLVHERAIPFRKDGSRLLFRLSELDDWLERQA